MKESRFNIWISRDGRRYVYNGRTGGLLSLTEDDYSVSMGLLGGGAPADASDTVALVQLVRGGMVIPDDCDELALLERGYEASRWDTSTFALTLVTSLGCNFDCPYCFEAKHPSLMDAAVRKAVLAVVDDQLPRITALNVTWYGGEPLVGKKAVFSLSEKFIERCDRANVGYQASIITNGALLDEATCEALRDRRVINAQITLDGPPRIHDKMRPYRSGRGTFWRIVKNLQHATKYLQVAVRVNVQQDNFSHVEELLQILAENGLAGRLVVYPAQIVAVSDNPAAPSVSYDSAPSCFGNKEFALAELEFARLAQRYGFPAQGLRRPVQTPCTAVRSNELVVGSKGELYKCWESVGNDHETIGNIWDYQNPNGRLHKWMRYSPFSNDECRSCIALPVCMGGCASHAMVPAHYEDRCGTFRHTYQEQVLAFIENSENPQPKRVDLPMPMVRQD